MTILTKIWQELSTSENPRGWFDYAESHLAHMMLGIISVAAISAGWLTVMGEFPDKYAMSVIVGAFWALYEYVTQGFDDLIGNVEDWLFLYAYSALPCILLFTEVPDTTKLVVDMANIGPIVAIVAAHLVTGMTARIYRALK